MISKYKIVSIIYGGKGRVYAEKLRKKIDEAALKDRYPLATRLVMEAVLTGDLLSDVMTLFQESEFCIAFLTADDICISGDETHFRVRQNVILEIGMALIQLGRKRCILLSDFDYSKSEFELPTDMMSLMILSFDKENLDHVLDDVLNKILQDSVTSIHTGISTDQVPQYNALFTRKDYFVHYEDLFGNNSAYCTYSGGELLSAMVEDWDSECSSLTHFDERCIYLFERLGFTPFLGDLPEVRLFLNHAMNWVEAYNEWDIRYYKKDTNLLSFVRMVVLNVVEYSMLKIDRTADHSLEYNRLLKQFLATPVPMKKNINPLIMVVYHDYLGLTYLRLKSDPKGDEYVALARMNFEYALKYAKKVDTSMSVWAGFLYHNIARTYAYQQNIAKASKAFDKAISIRGNWIRHSIFNVTIRNALSYEYFVARIVKLEMQEKSNCLSKNELRRELDNLETELNIYYDTSKEVGPLERIRTFIIKCKSEDQQTAE